jgi:hypothetical protein
MADEQRPDAGAYIGRKPEFAAETIPGGVREGDERVAATQSESSGQGAAEHRTDGSDDATPHGHREGDSASDDDVRRAGENG